MKAMVLNQLWDLEKNRSPLILMDLPVPEPKPGEILEKEIKSVANVARRDVEEFLALAAEIPITPEVQEFGLEEANQALLELKERKIRGVKVLRMEGP